MRLPTVFTIAIAIFIVTVTANKHKKTPCDMCTDGFHTCMDRCQDHRSERVCKAECDCQQGKDKTCYACGYGTGCSS